MAEVEFRDVRKSYGDTPVIHGVSMTIRDGEFVVIVGPSGCGKSTLLRMVAGLEQITGGEIAIGGRVVNRLEPKDRDIAMVFQNYALYPHMSVFDNMAYGLKIRGMAKAEIRERVAAAARILELEDYLPRKPRQLSGGQRQRVAMGRAIVREPKAFLFDEPLSNLDAKLRVQMRLEIKKLHRQLAVTSIYVTHDQVEAMTLADRLVVMNAGIAEQIGTPIDLYERPASTFVAGFIGSPAMNLLPATVRSDGAVEVAPGLSVRLPAAPPPPGAFLLGVRPEHLLPADGGPATFHLDVDVTEQLGADTLAHGRLADGLEAVVRLPGTHRVDAGERVPLHVDPARLHLFDPSSGRRAGTA